MDVHRQASGRRGKGGLVVKFVKCGTSIKLYNMRRQPPNWFDLEQWTKFETYFVGKDETGLWTIDVSLLLYDERRGCAYMIKWDMTGL